MGMSAENVGSAGARAAWCRAVLAIAVGGALGCGAPQPVSSPPAAPPTTGVEKSSVAVYSVQAPEPMLVQDQIEHVFTDPERKQKLTAALGDLDAWIQERGRALKLPGLVVGVVIDDEVVKIASYGYQDAVRKVPVTADSVFRVGSITKPMTAMVVLKLRDEGKLTLDAPAQRYLPELSGLQKPAKDARLPTIRHLLTHTSGLPREVRTVDDTNDEGTSEQALLKALRGLALEFEPGSRYQYSNLGFTLLGLIIARVTQTSYREAMQAHLFEPLGLTSAGWEVERYAGRLALPHKLDSAGEFVIDPKPEVFGAREPSGGLYISARDFGRFLAWQLSAHPAGSGPEDGVVRRSSRRESHDMGRLIGFGVRPARAESRWLAQADASAIGLSWHGYKTCDFDHVVFHNGLVHTYASDAAFLPEFGVGVFAFTNSAPSDLASLRRELLERLQGSGALLRRERRASRAPRLERALHRLLEVYGEWDEHKYDAMLSAWHKERITRERERVELEEYRALHGNCRPGPMLTYTSENQARYLLTCDKARLEMVLYLNAEGLIDGFVGHSSGVEPMPGAFELAERAVALLNRWDETAFDALKAPDFADAGRVSGLAAGLASATPCELGDFMERDGNRWQRFRVTCKRGLPRVLSLHPSDSDARRIDGLALEPIGGGPCAPR